MLNLLTYTLTALLCITCALGMAGATEKKPMKKQMQQMETLQPGDGRVSHFVSDELLAEVKDEAEAEQIADLYGVTLESVENGLAVFKLNEKQNVLDLVELGQSNGWPVVQPNYLYSLF